MLKSTEKATVSIENERGSNFERSTKGKVTYTQPFGISKKKKGAI